MDMILATLEHLVTSPWVYLLVFAVVAVDAFLPVVPSETVVIAAGVFASGGSPEVLLVVAVAALGAWVGDHVSYRLGWGASDRAQRMRRGSRGRRTLDWVESQMHRRGGMLLVAARFVPGGRTATTLAAGALRFPRRRFLVFVAIAAVCWSLYATLIGYWGGRLFEDDPAKALLLSFGVTMGLAGLAELARRSGVGSPSHLR